MLVYICVLFVHRSPHRPIHVQRLSLLPRNYSWNLNVLLLPCTHPHWLCCVCCKLPSTDRRPETEPPSAVSGSSSQTPASTPLQLTPPPRSCSRLWTPSTRTWVQRTTSTLTMLTTSIAPNPTDTEMTGCCRHCCAWSTSSASKEEEGWRRRKEWTGADTRPRWSLLCWFTSWKKLRRK